MKLKGFVIKAHPRPGVRGASGQILAKTIDAMFDAAKWDSEITDMDVPDVSCPACGRPDCHIFFSSRGGVDCSPEQKSERVAPWSNYTLGYKFKLREVIEERKPTLRDRLNPLYYIRKIIGEIMDPVVKRIQDAAAAIQASANNLADVITTEIAQFKDVIDNLRGSATNPDLSATASAELAATADKLEASVANIDAAAQAVKGIVPDTTPTNLPPQPIPTSDASGTEVKPPTPSGNSNPEPAEEAPVGGGPVPDEPVH